MVSSSDAASSRLLALIIYVRAQNYYLKMNGRPRCLKNISLSPEKIAPSEMRDPLRVARVVNGVYKLQVLILNMNTNTL